MLSGSRYMSEWMQQDQAEEEIEQCDRVQMKASANSKAFQEGLSKILGMRQEDGSLYLSIK